KNGECRSGPTVVRSRNGTGETANAALGSVCLWVTQSGRLDTARAMRLHRLSAVWVLGMGLGACAGERPQFGTSRPSGDASDATASDDAAVDTTVFDETNSDSTTAGDDTGTTSADSTAASTSDGTDTNSSDEDSR